jgi:hypothetical protein
MGWDRIGYIPRGGSNRTEQNSSGEQNSTRNRITAECRWKERKEVSIVTQ